MDENLQYQIFLGLQPWAAILVYGAVIIGAWYFWKKNKGKVKAAKPEQILCSFNGNNGQRQWFWCDVIGTSVELSVEEKKKLDKIAKENGGYKGEIEKMGAVKAPSGMGFDKYYTNAEFIFHTQWPIDKPPAQQKEIKICDFMVGIPLPIIGLNLNKWNSQMLQECASSLIGLSADEATMKALNAQDHTFWNNLSKVVQGLAGLSQMKIACFAAAAGGLIAALLAWMAYSGVQTLITVLMPAGGG